MDKTTRKKIMLGAFTFIAGVFLLLCIFLVGKKENLFNSTFTLSVIFTDINGTKKGNYVHFAGLRIGTVKAMTFVNDSTIVVDMVLRKEIQHLIKIDSKVYISTEGLVGDKIIDIKPVHKSKISINDHTTLIGINPFDTHEMIQTLLSTNDNANTISYNLAKLSDRLTKPHKGLLSSLTEDTTVVNDFTDIMSSLKNTGIQISGLSTRLKRITDNIDLDKGALGALLQDPGLKEDLSNTIKNLNTASDHSLKLVDKLNSSVNDSNNKNTISVLTKDSVFAKNLQEGIENFKTSTYKLDQNMEALKHNIFFRKYFKKQEKK
jgi:phospholipid/cholesterol/gamma-HCH transport system substrate-binding protein